MTVKSSLGTPSAFAGTGFMPFRKGLPMKVAKIDFR